MVDELVPRETEDRLKEFLELLTRWNRRINLLSRVESTDLWKRHVLDSAQIFPLRSLETRSWLDLGSGAGFPGLVCAAIAAAREEPIRFTLVEADNRKAAFLREAARQLELDLDVVNQRAETVALPPQDVVTARALTALDSLLSLSHPFIHDSTRLLFPKGRKAESELTSARRNWHIRVVRVPSRTDPESKIFQISEVRRRP